MAHREAVERWREMDENAIRLWGGEGGDGEVEVEVVDGSWMSRL